MASLLGEDERRMLMRPRLRMGASRAEPIRFMGDRPRLGEACTPCGMVLHHSTYMSCLTLSVSGFEPMHLMGDPPCSGEASAPCRWQCPALSSCPATCRVRWPLLSRALPAYSRSVDDGWHSVLHGSKQG